MKILYDHQIFSMQQYGGISRYFYEIANRIAETKKHSVEIFAPIYVNEYFRNDSMVRPGGIKIPSMPKTGRFVRIFNESISQLLLHMKQDVDIFHETYYTMADCRPHSAKRIITVHDMIHEKFTECFPQQDKTRKMKAHAVLRADHVICVSENTRRDLIELAGVPAEKTSVVYLGCSLSKSGNIEAPAVGRKPYILYVGQRGGYKNFEGLLRAYGSSPFLSKEFSLVCFGGGHFTARELSLMRTLGIPNDKVIYRAGGDDVLGALYAEAAVFVYPSLYEGFGIPPLEAMSYGCPVVCANTSSLPEVVGNAAELFDPYNISEMRVAIENVVTSKERVNFLVKRGYQRCKQFSWEKCASETLDVYKRVLQG